MVCLVVGFVILAIIVLVVVMHHRRKKWTPAKGEVNSAPGPLILRPSAGGARHVININASAVSGGGAPPATSAGGASATYTAAGGLDTPRTPAGMGRSTGGGSTFAVSGGGAAAAAAARGPGVIAMQLDGEGEDPMALPPPPVQASGRRAHFVNPLSVMPPVVSTESATESAAEVGAGFGAAGSMAAAGSGAAATEGAAPAGGPSSGGPSGSHTGRVGAAGVDDQKGAVGWAQS